MWIKRDILKKIQSLPSNFVGILSGPRQSGKTALLVRCLGDKVRILECDDLDTRLKLNQDPALIFGDITTPLIIDEAQYAPNIFPELKLRIDRARRGGIKLPPIWITGSNQTMMDKNVQESLSGRSFHLSLFPLSIHELVNAELYNLEKYIWRGGWPELVTSEELDPVQYLDDYIRTFVERDIAASAGITKTGEFLLCLKLLSNRIGQLLNASEIGMQAGIKGDTLSNWIHILERNHLVSLVRPYHLNLNKRLIKTPKLYFTDSALAVRLQGWRAFEPLLLSPQIGFLFENVVYSELLRAKAHLGFVFDIFSYRTKEGEEVDFLLQGQHKSKGEIWLALEVKFARQGQFKVDWPKSLLKDFRDKDLKRVIITATNKSAKTTEGDVLPLASLAEYLNKWLGEV